MKITTPNDMNRMIDLYQERHQINDKEMAARFGVPYVYIWRWRTGRVSKQVKLLIALAIEVCQPPLDNTTIL